MGNCLVTKLKEIVNNDNLEKLGDIKIGVNLANVTAITLKYKVSTDIRIVGEGHFTDETGSQDLGKTATINTVDTTVWLSTGTYNLFISDKYNLQYFSTTLKRDTADEFRANVEDFSYINYSTLQESFILNLSKLYSSSTAKTGLYGNLDKLVIKNLLNLRLSGSWDVTGNIDAFINNNPLVNNISVEGTNIKADVADFIGTNVHIFKGGRGGFYGNFNDLGKSSIDRIEYLAPSYNYLEGSIEEFVQTCLENGRATVDNTLTIENVTGYNAVTYNGTPLTQQFTGGKVFSWDDQGNITVGN